MKLLLPLLAAACLGAVESDPLELIRVIDGDTIHVRGQVPPGHPVALPLRLKWIEAPEARDNPHGKARPSGRAATAALQALLPAGSEVVLWYPEDEFYADRGARTLCVVHPVADGAKVEPSLQETLVAAGHAVYWRRYGEAPAPLHEKLVAAMAAAREAGLGVWGSDPEWAAATAAER